MTAALVVVACSAAVAALIVYAAHAAHPDDSLARSVAATPRMLAAAVRYRLRHGKHRLNRRRRVPEGPDLRKAS